MASEDVTWGDSRPIGEERETLASAAESWTSSDCGSWKETEGAALPERKLYILLTVTFSDLKWSMNQWRVYNNNNNFNSPI